MNQFSRLFVFILGTSFTFAGHAQNPLLKALNDTIAKANAHIAVAIDYIPHNKGKRVHLGVHEHDTMVTMSVIKLPIAISTLHQIELGGLGFNQKVFFDSVEMQRQTYSPIKEGHSKPFTTTLENALSYSVSRSDNVATDIVLDAMKGPATAQKYLTDKGYNGMQIGSAYRNMSVKNRGLNWSTAACMNQLLVDFYSGRLLNKENTQWLFKQLLESPTTSNRLKGKLPAGTAVAHKTGTMYDDSHPNYEEAINDVGIIVMPSGDVIAISVFINESYMNPEQTELFIANIALMCYKHFSK